MHTYKIINNPDGIPSWIDRSDGLVIPIDENNMDYQTYVKWLDGYTRTPEGWVKTSDPNTPEVVNQQPE